MLSMAYNGLGNCCPASYEGASIATSKTAPFMSSGILDHIVLNDVVDKQCQQMVERVELLKEEFLVHSRLVSGVPDLRRSIRAILNIDGVYVGDIVWRAGANILPSEDVLRVRRLHACTWPCFKNAAGEPDQFDECRSVDAFVDTRTVIDTSTWYRDSPSILKVAVPHPCNSECVDLSRVGDCGGSRRQTVGDCGSSRKQAQPQQQ